MKRVAIIISAFLLGVNLTGCVSESYSTGDKQADKEIKELQKELNSDEPINNKPIDVKPLSSFEILDISRILSGNESYELIIKTKHSSGEFEPLDKYKITGVINGENVELSRIGLDSRESIRNIPKREGVQYNRLDVSAKPFNYDKYIISDGNISIEFDGTKIKDYESTKEYVSVNYQEARGKTELNSLQIDNITYEYIKTEKAKDVHKEDIEAIFIKVTNTGGAPFNKNIVIDASLKGRPIDSYRGKLNLNPGESEELKLKSTTYNRLNPGDIVNIDISQDKMNESFDIKSE